MFLAINEIKHSKLRYGLVIGMIFLISYLVFFLTGLAYGLAEDNKTAVDKWRADRILLSDKANNNLNMSTITTEQFNQVKADEKAPLSQVSNIVYNSNNEDNKQNVSFFGVNSKDFIAPNIVQGEMFSDLGEVVADISLKDEEGFRIGDTLTLATNGYKLKIVGFTDNSKYNTSPVLYTSFETINKVQYNNKSTIMYNAVVTRGNVSETVKGLDSISISDFINKIPGYSAQLLTFGFMIGFLILISTVVIGIFIYVLTMQKKSVLGIMKAQGISTGYIANSTILQTLLLSVIGVILGLLLTFLSSLVLPSAVPFQTNWLFFIVIAILMIVTSVIGSLFSIKSIVKIDPLKSIG